MVFAMSTEIDVAAKATNGGHNMKPHTIWSLWDMLRFYAASFSATVITLSKALTILESGATLGFPDEGLGAGAIKSLLEECDPHIRKLPFSIVTLQLLEDTIAAAKNGLDIETRILLRQTIKSITVELSAHHYLMIKEDRKLFYKQEAPPFGPDVQDRFPTASLDVAAASRCYALDEWTACAFHLMRVVEHGLRWLASDVGLQESEIDGENWKNVIDLIEKKIRLLEQTKKTPEKIARTKALGEAAVQIRYFKDAWRNHVAHVLQNYDENSAEPVWDSVKRFMQTLADPTFPSSQSKP